MRLRLCCSFLGAVLGAACPVLGHDPGLSSSRVAVERDAIAVVVTFDDADLEQVVGSDANREAVFTAFVRGAVRVTIDGVSLAADEAIARPTDEADDLAVHLRFARPTGTTLSFALETFDRLPRGHRHFVAVVDQHGAPIHEALLHRNKAVLETETGHPVRAGSWSLGLRFFELGWEHILIGFDHLLFLIVLLLGTRRLTSAAAIITAFTVAHSITLALASLDLVRLPSAVVESVIALSIVYVAIENLVRGEARHRWRITFAFGLVHGFGFASVLRELGIANAGGVAVPLLSFNLGVESGQLAVAAIAWPALSLLRKSPQLRRRALPAASCAVALVGGWWFVERAMLGA